MNISIIVAIAGNNAIGKDNKLLCHISEDLKRFKKLTTGHTIVMGKKTWQSLPKRPLPNRTNIVISDDRNDKFEGCIMAYSIEEAIDKCSAEDENFIIGGASIYNQFLKHSNKLYITRINKIFDADTFFPLININEWKLIEKEENIKDVINNFDYNYEVYIKTAKFENKF
jgi:dihydrofolate reductase